MTKTKSKPKAEESRARRLPFAPLKTFRDILKECPDLMARKLARAADINGMWPKDVAKFPKLLDAVGLDIEDIHPATIGHANEVFRRSSEESTAYERRRNDHFLPDASEPDPTPEPQKERPTTVKHERRKKIFGFPVTASIRWMKDEGWNFSEVRQVLKRLQIEVSDHTIRCQLRYGDDYGKAAKFSKDQANHLYDLLEDEKF